MGPIVDIHVRASSQKEKIKMNKKLIVFFLHIGNLYSWIQGEPDLELVCETQSHSFHRINDSSIVLRNDYSKNDTTIFRLQ